MSNSEMLSSIIQFWVIEFYLKFTVWKNKTKQNMTLLKINVFVVHKSTRIIFFTC